MKSVEIDEVTLPCALGGSDPLIDVPKTPPFWDEETDIVVASVMVSKESWEYMGKRSAGQLPGTVQGIPSQVESQVRNEVLIEYRKLGVVIGLLVPEEACTVEALRKCLVRIFSVAKAPEELETRRYDLLAGN